MQQAKKRDKKGGGRSPHVLIDKLRAKKQRASFRFVDSEQLLTNQKRRASRKRGDLQIACILQRVVMSKRAHFICSARLCLFRLNMRRFVAAFDYFCLM